jgi:hypothetical protein
VNNFVISAIAPSAASATVGGHIYSPKGKPLANANVMMFDSMGNTRTTTSDTAGYYSFADIRVGEIYVFEIRSKQYVFSQPIKVLSVLDDYTGLDFHASFSSRTSSTVRSWTGKN